MKYYSIAFGIVILLSACSTRNAFSSLGIEKEQELAIENTRNGKIILKDEVRGLYSAVYLNNVYPQTKRNTHDFYISSYLKDRSVNSLLITLDKKIPVETIELKENNKFSSLLPLKSSWRSNYLVSFKKEKNLNINLSIDSDQFSSGPLNYILD